MKNSSDMFTQTIGNKSNNNTQNIFVNHFKKTPLIPTILFDLLSFVQEFKTDSNTEFTLHNPAKINAKLKFNKSRKYIRKFSEGIDDFILLDEILKEKFIDSEKIINNIKFIFLDLCDYDVDGNIIVVNGDECLDKMFEKIKGKIVNDPKFSKSSIDDFDIDKFIVALLQECVFKCQILLNPNDY